MTTAFQKLLKYPHAAVFDKQPGALDALTLNAAWSVADGVLTVAHGTMAPVDLSQHTLSTLRTLLLSSGLTVTGYNSTLGKLSALVLIEGSGAAGVALQAYTSMLWVLLGSFAREVLDQRAAVSAALDQMDLNQAEDVWVDLHGALYGTLSRLPDEQDRAYADRIKAEALRLRVNKFGIEKAVLDATGYVIAINEPWEEQFHLDSSVLSGPHRMYDGSTVGPHLIQPIGGMSVNWDVVLPVIHRNKAAGVIVLEPITSTVFAVDATASDSGVRMRVSGRTALGAETDDTARLDYMSLDGDAHVPVHPSRQLQRHHRASGAAMPSLTWADLPGWTGGTWATTTYFAWPSRATSEFEVRRIRVVYSGQLWDTDVTWGTGGDWTGVVPRVTLRLTPP